jgi:NAD(P)H dehydrogenase (quinone)
MAAKILVLGASGRVGSQLVTELDKNSDGISVLLASSRKSQTDGWIADGRDAVVLDLNNPDGFEKALSGVDRVFLLTGYTSDMLFQSKKLVDAAVAAGVSHIVHLGVFTSRRDMIPHFNWHDLVETYIEASGISWPHLHPNVIADTTLVTDPPISVSGVFQSFDCVTPQGWVFASDIAAVASAVLREGPEMHGGKEYWLSTELLTGAEVADALTAAAGREIECQPMDRAAMKAGFEQIPSVATRAYMESALITLDLCVSGQMKAQTVVRDDVQTVLGRPGLTIAEWAQDYFKGGNG